MPASLIGSPVSNDRGLHGRHQPRRNSDTGEHADREDGYADHHVGQQFGLPQATTGCVCTDTTIAVPVPTASASKAKIMVVIFMLLSPKP